MDDPTLGGAPGDAARGRDPARAGAATGPPPAQASRAGRRARSAAGSLIHPLESPPGGLARPDGVEGGALLIAAGAALDALYGGSQLAATQLEPLLEWLAALHGAFGGDQRARRLENRAMRELNHEHISVLPLEGKRPVDVDQHTPGLGAAAAELRADRMLAAETARLGARYLAREGSALLYGNFCPGSWLQDETAP